MADKHVNEKISKFFKNLSKLVFYATAFVIYPWEAAGHALHDAVFLWSGPNWRSIVWLVTYHCIVVVHVVHDVLGLRKATSIAFNAVREFAVTFYRYMKKVLLW